MGVTSNISVNDIAGWLERRVGKYTASEECGGDRAVVLLSVSLL